MSNLIINKKIDFLVVALVFVIYQITLAPSVVQIDSGELAAVQYSLGIAHPSGYPLFTILGYLFGQIPMPISKIYQFNLLASIYTTISVFFIIRSIRLILGSIVPVKQNVKQNRKKQNKISNLIPKLSEFQISVFSITGGLIAAFSKTFWFQSTSVEVYS